MKKCKSNQNIYVSNSIYFNLRIPYKKSIFDFDYNFF